MAPVYNPIAPTLERLAALRALIDAGRYRDVVIVMPPACGKSVAIFDWKQADIRAKTPRGVHVQTIPGDSA